MNNWIVKFTTKAKKQSDKLPKRERDILITLTHDLQLNGAILPDWPTTQRLVEIVIIVI